MKKQDDSAQIIAQQNDEILTLRQQITELNARVKWYEEQFRLSRQKQFGGSSEKTSVEQISLFNEAEDISNPKLEEVTVEEITYQRKKKQVGQREEKLADLPVEEIEYRLSEEEQICPIQPNNWMADWS